MNYMAIPGEQWRGIFAESDISVRVNKVLNAVCLYYGVTLADMQVRCKKAKIVVPRQVALYLLKHMLGMGCVDSAAIFNMDHTSAIHSCRRVQDIIDTEENFAKEIRRIKENIF